MVKLKNELVSSVFSERRSKFLFRRKLTMIKLIVFKLSLNDSLLKISLFHFFFFGYFKIF